MIILRHITLLVSDFYSFDFSLSLNTWHMIFPDYALVSLPTWVKGKKETKVGHSLVLNIHFKHDYCYICRVIFWCLTSLSLYLVNSFQKYLFSYSWCSELLLGLFIINTWSSHDFCLNSRSYKVGDKHCLIHVMENDNCNCNKCYQGETQTWEIF